MRPFLCRQGYHRWGVNTMWPKSQPGLVRWERHCTRCGALLAFAGEPFLFGLDRKARRALRDEAAA